MKKALRIIAVTSAVISLASTLILGFLYIEGFNKRIKEAKAFLADKIINRNNEE